MKHPTGRTYSEYEMSLINGTAPTKHKPQSLIEINYSYAGCRISHQSRGNMERLREKQRKNNGSQRGLFSVVELPDEFDGIEIYNMLGSLDGIEILYDPHQGGDNFWGVSITAKITPEVAHKHINEYLSSKEKRTENIETGSEVIAPSIKGIF